MPFKKLASSTEYVGPAIIVAEDLDGAGIDPTTDTVEWAFIQDGRRDPVDGDFVAGVWATEVDDDGTEYRTFCLVGPAGGVTDVAKGVYKSYVRIIDSPEVPWREVEDGLLTVV